MGHEPAHISEPASVEATSVRLSEIEYAVRKDIALRGVDDDGKAAATDFASVQNLLAKAIAIDERGYESETECRETFDLAVESAKELAVSTAVAKWVAG